MQTGSTGQWREAWRKGQVLIAMAAMCFWPTAIAQAVNAPAQPPAEFMVKAWSMADGLPHLSVTALRQTRDGYIWIGTLAGLVRFDGVKFKVFTPQNCPELPRSRIGRLFESADGTLFIATERGGGLVAFREGKFEQLLGAGNEQDEVTTCLNEPGGTLLFAARSGALWRWTGGRLTVLSTNRTFYPLAPAQACEDQQGRVWMLSRAEESGRLLRFKDALMETVSLPTALAGCRIRALAQDAQGQVWLGTSQGLALLRGDQFEPVELPDMGRAADITELAASRDGGLWVCCSTNYWVRKYQGGRWVGPAGRIAGVQSALEVLGEDRWGRLCLGHYPEGFVTASPEGVIRKLDTANGLPGTTVSCYLADREGNEWLGLADGGLVRLQPRRFSILGQSVLNTTVYSICEDYAGSVWVGSSFGGVYRFQGTNATRYGPSELPLTDIWSLFEDSRSNLWVGTSSHGIYQFRDGRFVSMFDRSRVSDRVNAIYEDRQGRIWFGLWSGLACYAEGQLTQTPMPWFSDECEVVAITADTQDRLWLGTKGAGLICLEQGKFSSYTVTNGLPSNLAWSLFVDRTGTLWVGTADGGLSCWKEGRFVNFTARDGLGDSTICHILEDTMGRFWFSSPHGVFWARRQALEAFARGETRTFSCTAYDQSDGLLSAACTCAFQPSACATRDGRLLFPTLKGVAVVRPDEVRADPVPPPVLIEEVTVGGKIRELTAGGPLRTPPGRSRMEIRYTALNFSAPEKVRFSYQMEGLDTDWTDGGSERVVAYPYLPHGRYRFRVKARNGDGVWSAESASLDLTISPYFWQTWWFIAAALLGSAAAIALTARSLEKIQTRRRLERQQQVHLVELERARIARDFHDEIGSCLTHLIVLSELVRGDKNRPQEVEADATMIGNTARNAVRGLGTIIWAVNPRNDTLDSLVQYISQYSFDFFQATAISCHLDLPTEVPALPLTAEVRHNLFMVIKEALHNVLKHSQASQVRLGLKLDEGTLKIRVEDNGRGFRVELAAANRRSGLANMQHRAEAIGAHLEIKSSSGTGTAIQVRLPYPAEWVDFAPEGTEPGSYKL